ncbi:DUF433 domain-containing protein [Microcoleus sp. D3_18_C4]|uniref:DUF433 domain-containing protein n=1 Tax=Microcoleus sp. D3_18_C4 TaxID=3055335 RepID=UPI002FD1A6CE
MSLTERLRLATLILNELSQPNLAVVEPSDTWTEEDCLDFTTFSLQYAATIFHSDPDILGGSPVFIATRVPIETLLDYLEAGDSIDEFFDHFASVSGDRAISVLAMIRSPHNNI